MADVFVDENSLKGIANAIRAKNGSSATYTPAEMVQAIQDLQIPDVSDLDATAADILYPKKAFTADGETEGTIQTKSASDVTVSGDTVSSPAGYYPNAVSKSVQSGSATTPATIIPANPTISVNNSTGLVTASVNETQAITPTISEGYVSAGTSGHVRASGSATSQLPTQSAATITPTQSQQTAVVAGKFTTGDVVVDPIPSEYIVPTGTKQISITQNGTTTEDVSAYANAQITANVPNTYAAADEGKVVNNGALVAQGSDTVTQNGTVDTTLINSLTVNVSGGGGGFTIDEVCDRDVAAQGSNWDLVIPTATRIPPYYFGRGTMKSVSAPNVKYFTHYRTDKVGDGSFVFEACTSLQTAYFPELISAGVETNSNGYQFSGCTSLTHFHAPKCSWANHMFDGCTSLTNIALGYGRSTKTEMRSYMFRWCTSLVAVDLSNVSKLNSNLLRDSSATVLILRDAEIVTCGSMYVFDNSVFKNGGTGGTIYIPKSLYNHLGDGGSYDYKSATNWATYDGYGTITWAQIEGSIYETQYADGTSISI